MWTKETREGFFEMTGGLRVEMPYRTLLRAKANLFSVFDR